MVMEVMASLESPQVGDAREVFAAMVLPVVHDGEIVVSGIHPEDEKGSGSGLKHEIEQPQITSAPVMTTKSGALISALGSAWCCA